MPGCFRAWFQRGRRATAVAHGVCSSERPNSGPHLVHSSCGEHTEPRVGPGAPLAGQSSQGPGVGGEFHVAQGHWQQEGQCLRCPSSPPAPWAWLERGDTSDLLQARWDVGDLRSLPSLVFLTCSFMEWDILPCSCHLPEPLPAGSLPAQATRSPSVLASSREDAAGREEEEVHAEETLPCLPGPAQQSRSRYIPCSGRTALSQELGLAQGWQQLEGPMEL